MSLPFSIMRILRLEFLTSSIAAKIPAGPEPIMMMSYEEVIGAFADQLDMVPFDHLLPEELP
jgi:hypothetical protein